MPAMITLDPGQLEHWLLQLFWPFVRIGACFMIAPVFGAAAVPARVRIVLAGGFAALLAPLLPAPPDVSPLSGTGLLITAHPGREREQVEEAKALAISAEA